MKTEIWGAEHNIAHVVPGEPITDEVWLLAGSAGPVPVFVDSFPLKDDAGGVIGVIATATDPKRWSARAERLRQSISVRDGFVGG